MMIIIIAAIANCSIAEKLAMRRTPELIAVEPQQPPVEILNDFAIARPIEYFPELVVKSLPVTTPATCARRTGIPKPFILIRPKDWG